MRRRIVGALVVILCAAPVAASALTTAEAQAQIDAILAQIAQLREQIRVLKETAVQEAATSTANKPFGTTTPALSYRHPICGLLTRNITWGHTGDDVKAWQDFLKLHGFLQADSTGYFGILTSAALSRWQAANSIPTVGVVGPQTRELILRWCRGESLWPPAGQCPQDTQQCSDGSKVGRTGLLCQFSCPADNATSTPVCTEEYAPVCAFKRDICETKPCTAAQQTYGNRCKAKNDAAVVFYAGECSPPAQTTAIIPGAPWPTVFGGTCIAPVFVKEKQTYVDTPFKEGEMTTRVRTLDGSIKDLFNALYVCRGGVWKAEQGL